MPDSLEPRTPLPSGPQPGADPVQRLWHLWRQGQRPDVRAFLAQTGDLDPACVLAVLRLDQRQRWQAGESVRAEAYLEAYPELQSDPEYAVELIYGEILLRESRGETSTLEEYTARFPQCAPRLRLQFEIHQ